MEMAFISSMTAVLVPPFYLNYLIIYLVEIQQNSKNLRWLLIWGTILPGDGLEWVDIYKKVTAKNQYTKKIIATLTLSSN